MANTDLFTPDDCALVLIDHQPQMAFGVQSIDRQTLINNTVLLATVARIFSLPTVLTAVETESFSGYLWPQILDLFPGVPVIERSSMNSWDDQGFRAAVRATGRKRLVIAALWTEVCLTFPALEALRDGYEVAFVSDASGGTTKEAHDLAVQRLIQAGAIPLTAQQFLLEMQRDWSRKATYDAVIAAAKAHGGAYGLGIEYAFTMVHKGPQSAKYPQVVGDKAGP